MNRPRCGAFVVCFVACSSAALAQGKGSTPAAPRRWYGWQLLLVDGPAVGAVAASLRYDVAPLYTVGALVYLLIPPGIHDLHGDVGKSFGSLVTRALLPAIGWGIFESYAEPDLGIAVGALTAIALDVIFIAWEDAPREDSR